MIDHLSLFRGRDYVINEHIKIHQPTLDEISEFGEQKYYSLVSMLCATPSDYKVQLLDKFELDYETVSEFEFFCMMCSGLQLEQTSIIFGHLDFSKLLPMLDTQINEIVLRNEDEDITIDSGIYMLIVSCLRTIHNFERNVEIAGNEHTKKYMFEKERRKMMRRQSKAYESVLLPLVSALINCEQFKYNHDTVWDLPMYVFMDSLQRIQRIKNYSYVMQGAYAGTVDMKRISQEKINWTGSLNES